jgi:hypothetical protein
MPQAVLGYASQSTFLDRGQTYAPIEVARVYMGIGVFAEKYPDRLVSRDEALEEHLRFLIQPNVLDIARFRVRQGQDAVP